MHMMKAYVEGLLYGLMVYWEEVEDAARYRVHLFVNDETYTPSHCIEIAAVEVPRDIRYYAFQGLANLRHKRSPGYAPMDTKKGYIVSVEAEDRAGKVIASTCKMDGITDELVGHSYIANR